MAIFLVSNLNMPFLGTSTVHRSQLHQCYADSAATERYASWLSHRLDGFLDEGYFFVGEVVLSVKLTVDILYRCRPVNIT